MFMSPRPMREKLACMSRPRSTQIVRQPHAHVDGGGVVEARARDATVRCLAGNGAGRLGGRATVASVLYGFRVSCSSS